jgi:hypothetical protein
MAASELRPAAFAGRLVLGIAGAKLLLHLLLANRDGYSRETMNAFEPLLWMGAVYSSASSRRNSRKGRRSLGRHPRQAHGRVLFAFDEPVFPFAVLAMVAGPSAAGILLTGLIDGRGSRSPA